MIASPHQARVTTGASPGQAAGSLAAAIFPALGLGFAITLAFDLDPDNEGFLIGIGIVAALTAALFAFQRVRFDDAGITVRRPWGTKRAAWHEIRAFTFARETAGATEGIPGYELVVEVGDATLPRPGEPFGRWRRRSKAARRRDLVLLTTQSISATQRPPATFIGRYAERQLATALEALAARGVRHRGATGALEPADSVPYVRMLWERA